MHCIDCHFLQDVHGDGHVYSTNWDTIEIECEDCHGAKAKATLITSGPNGGNDLRRAQNADRQPFFVDGGGGIVQRSRVTPGVFWKIPQTADITSPTAVEAHDAKHMAEPRQGSTFAGAQGQSPLTDAKVECQTCHSSWVHNCMGCHIDLNLFDKQRKLVDAAGGITRSAHENETWMSNANATGHINFQLLGLLRSPLVLGTGSIAEGGRLAPFRSSMQAHVSITDATGAPLTENQTFTTFQTLDANSKRMNVATSGVAMNQTMPHTTRPSEARGCDTCHALVDAQGRVRNEHVLAETFGLGTGAYPFVGDWTLAAGTGGLALYEYKAEGELAANKGSTTQRFPGLIVNPANPTAGGVEPLFDGSAVGLGATAVDVALVRNFNPTPAIGGTAPPTLRDLAVLAVDDGGAGALVISDITARGHPGNVRPSVGDARASFVLALPAAPLALAHLAPDVSDPFVYIAVGAAGVTAVRLLDAPGAAIAARIASTTALAGHAVTDVALAGDLLYAGTAEGTIEVLSLADPEHPAAVASVAIDAVHGIVDLAVTGFVLYAATAAGITALALGDPEHPVALAGSSVALAGVNGMFVSAGHLYAAATTGVFDLDVRTPAAPVAPVNLSAVLAPGQPINAVDVIVSKLPGQTWLLALDASGDLFGLKLDNTRSVRERCFPDPRAAGCLLDLDFLDPTVMQRDPSFDPNTGTFDAADPSSPTFFRIAHNATLITSGRRLARPAIWEQLNTLTGRRLRDSFMPGSGTLSLGIMQTMRSVQVCESAEPSTTASGLNQLGYPDGAICLPFGQSQRPASLCRMLPTGQAACVPRATISSGAPVLGPVLGPPAPAAHAQAPAVPRSRGSSVGGQAGQRAPVMPALRSSSAGAAAVRSAAHAVAARTP
jgi:hypothetical protein